MRNRGEERGSAERGGSESATVCALSIQFLFMKEIYIVGQNYREAVRVPVTPELTPEFRTISPFSFLLFYLQRSIFLEEYCAL